LLFALTAAPAEKPAALERVDFDEAIRRSLRQNLTSQTAREEIVRAEGLLGEARAGSIPTLVGTAVYQRLDGDRVLNGSVISSKNQEFGNAALTLPLLVPSRWGQWSHGVDALDVAVRSEKDAERQVALLAGRAYLAVVAQTRVVDVTQRAKETAQAHYNYSHTRYAGGVGNRVDEVRAEQELHADEAQVQVALTNLARTREALGITTGTDSALDVAEDPKLPDGPPANEGNSEAEALRTDLRVAQSRVDAADHIVRDSWLDYLPTMLGVAQPFFQNPPLLTTPTTGWQAQLVLTWTVYDGGIRPAQYKERVAGANEARASLDAALRQAHSDVRLSYEELQRADEALVAARRSAERAKLALQLATQAYQAGATGNLEVIDAERVALDAETNAVVSEDAVRQARLDLLAATGHFPY
jgi:outer membrane protein